MIGWEHFGWCLKCNKLGAQTSSQDWMSIMVSRSVVSPNKVVPVKQHKLRACLFSSRLFSNLARSLDGPADPKRSSVFSLARFNRRNTNSAASHPSLGFKLPTGISCAPLGRLFLVGGGTAGGLSTSLPPPRALSYILLSGSALSTVQNSSQILASDSGSALLPPGGQERELSSALTRLIILSANRRRDFLLWV